MGVLISETDACRKADGLVKRIPGNTLRDEASLKITKVVQIQSQPDAGSEKPFGLGALVQSRSFSLRSVSNVTPWHQLIQTGDLMIGDLGQNPCQPSLPVNFVQFGSLDGCVGDCGRFTATL